jgi:TPR repeat protein
VPPDPLAQFFMAMLYEGGHGVPRDTIRACGLY